MSFRGAAISPTFIIDNGGGIRPRYKSGLWYKGGTAAGAASASPNNQLNAYPIWFPPGISFDQWEVQVTTLLAGGSGRFGIYRDAGNGYPGALVAEWGIVSMAAAGIVINNFVPAFSPSPGLYWLAGVQQGGAGGAWRLGLTTYGAWGPPIIGDPSNSLILTQSGYAYESAGVTGALPNPFPTPPTSRGSSGINVGLHVV